MTMLYECENCHRFCHEDEMARIDEIAGYLCYQCQQVLEQHNKIPDYDGLLRWVYCEDDDD
jgi:hypothetical protein